MFKQTCKILKFDRKWSGGSLQLDCEVITRDINDDDGAPTMVGLPLCVSQTWAKSQSLCTLHLIIYIILDYILPEPTATHTTLFHNGRKNRNTGTCYEDYLENQSKILFFH